MDTEVDFIYLIKQMRYIDLALKHLLPTQKRAELNQKSEYITINESSDDKKQSVAKKDLTVDQIPRE